MATTGQNGLLDAIRGGQIVKHYIAMAKQVFWYAFGFGQLTFFLLFCGYMTFTWQKVEALAYFNWIQSWYLVEFQGKGHKTLFYMKDFGDGFSAKASAIYYDEAVNFYADKFIAKMWIAGMIGLAGFALLVYLIVRLFTSKGRDQVEDEKIRGNDLVSVKELIKIIKTEAKKVADFKLGKIKIGGIPIPEKFETQGFAAFGAPGSGKTVLYGDLAEEIRRSGKRAIVNDRSGTLMQKFYREGDIILNPIDVRCAPWSLFNECHHKHDFDKVATILFPTQNGDPFWYEAPRTVFVSLAMKEQRKEKPSLHRLTKFILTCEVEQLVELCKNTIAQSLIDENVIRQTNSLRGVIITKLQAFLLFEDHKQQGFSIRDWVACDDTKNWIWITSNKDQEASLRPLITCWLEIGSSSILSLPPLMLRRIWLLFDELHTLDKVASLASTLAEIRKYGGCGVIGFQGYKQAVDIYGVNGVDGLIDSCSTGIYLRQNAQASAEFAAKQLGRKDLIEATNNISYGASSVRDGQNHGHQRHLRDLVLPSEIQGLPDLFGFLRLGRGLPVAQFKLKYKDRKDVTEGFIEDTDKLHRLDRIVTDPNDMHRIGGDRDEGQARDKHTQRELETPIDDLSSFDVPFQGGAGNIPANEERNQDMMRFANEPLPLPLEEHEMPGNSE